MNNFKMHNDVCRSSVELAEMLKQDPGLTEKEILQSGKDLIAIFEDANFSDSFQDLKAMKKDLFLAAIEDLSMGAPTLKMATIGLSFHENRIKTFICPLSAAPEGNVIASIALKNSAAFKNWRNEMEELSDEAMQAALYRMIVALSKVL